MPNTYLGSTTLLNVEKKVEFFTPDKGKSLGQGTNQSTFELNTLESSSSTHTHTHTCRSTPGQQVALDCVWNHAGATVVFRCCTESQGPSPPTSNHSRTGPMLTGRNLAQDLIWGELLRLFI